MDEATLSDIYESHLTEQHNQNYGTKKIARSFSQTQLKWIGIAGVIVYYFVSISKEVSPRTGWGAFVVIIVLFYFSNQKDADSGQSLSDEQAKAILYNHLKKKQSLTNEISPNAIIRLKMACKLPKFQSKDWKWIIAFDIEEQDGIVSSYTADLHNITGAVSAIKEWPEGWTGREVNDISYIPSREQLWERIYYGGKSSSRSPLPRLQR